MKPALSLLVPLLLLLGSYTSLLGQTAPQPFRSDPDKLSPLEAKVEALLAQMTLAEKIGQMTQVRHFSDITDADISERLIGSVIHTSGPLPGTDAIGWQAKFASLQQRALSTRLGIPLMFGVDAIHGQNTFNGATIFPHNIGMGATANPQLVQETAAITALEAQATGFNWVFAPCIAIPYNERWGRVYEAFSEHTSLTQQLVRASVAGHQGNLADPATVVATAKHFIGDGATDYGKEGGTMTLNMQEIHERLLPPYHEAVKAGVGAVMVGFNSFEGVPMHAHKALITDTLKEAWGFDGIVVSDWKGYSRFGRNAIINAGVDVVMAVDGDMAVFQDGLRAGIEDGSVPMARVDDAVRRILRQKFRLGLFASPYPNPRLASLVGHADHRDKARQAVRESLVLLKHQNQVLPLDKDAHKIVVVGEHAHNAGLQSGGWTVDWQGTKETYAGATTILEGIQETAHGQVLYDTTATGEHFDADVVIIVVGEMPYAEFMGDIGEGTAGLTLSPAHQQYVDAYANKGPDVVVLLVSGRPLVTTRQIEQADAFVAAWLLGSEGDGVAEVLFGDYNFSGKLPHSWPKSVADFAHKYGPNFWDPEVKPLFEFGFGLTY